MSNVNSKIKIFTALIIASMLFKIPAYARPEDGGRPHGPPPEAIEACADLAEGDTCSFTGRRNDEVKGTCMAPPQGGDEELACAPEGGPPTIKTSRLSGFVF